MSYFCSVENAGVFWGNFKGGRRMEGKKLNGYADYHVHTSFSDDCKCPMQEIILRGIELGLDEICFTEHVDYGDEDRIQCDYALYLQTLQKMKEEYGEKISLKFGIEFGVQESTAEIFEKDIEKWPFDFVILSNHQVDNKTFWNYKFQEGKTQEEIHRAYYEGFYRAVKRYKNYSVLGHLDAIKRYDPYGEYPDDKVIDMVEKILKTIIADGKGIEINTACFRYGLKDLTPSTRILNLYRELGGEILTFGSDTHQASQLADHFEEARSALKKLGFHKICRYENMQPIFYEL